MNRQWLLGLLAAGALAATSVLATAQENEAKEEASAANSEEQCARYAKEDGVPKDELDAYMKACIDDLRGALESDSEQQQGDR